MTVSEGQNEDCLTDHWSVLDGIRGILAVAVMFYHYGVNVIFARLTLGLVHDAPLFLAVDFFFVLSGCVLARSYLRRPRPMGRRFLERAFRLLPLHFLIMLALVPLYFIGQDREWFTPLRDQGAGAILADLASVALLTNHFTWNSASWTIGVELYVPVLLAAVLPCANGWRPSILLALGVGTLFWQAWCIWELAILVPVSGLERGLCGLSLGGIIYLLIYRRIIVVPHTRLVLPLLVIAIGVIMVLGRNFPVISLLLAPLFAATVALGTNAAGVLGRGLFAWLGRISFSLYLIHLPVKVWIYYFLGVDALDGRLDIKMLQIAGVLLLATLLARYVELPGIRAGKRVGLWLETRATGHGDIARQA